MPNINDLRDHLFDTLKALKDKDNPMDIERARAVAQVADVIVETAKVEVRMLEVTGGTGSGFIPQKSPDQGALPSQNGNLMRLMGGKP